MAKIVLISCARKKLDHRVKAEELYLSTLFKKSLEYAKSISPDRLYILSAKYGLLDLNREIDSYDKTLNSMSIKERKNWANSVLSELEKVADLSNDEFIFLAGNKYREFIIEKLRNYKIPMQGLSIGRQLHWLNEKV